MQLSAKLGLFAAAIALPSSWIAACATPSASSSSGSGEQPARLEFELKDLQGKVVRTSDYAGHVVLVDLWATWCRPCEHSMPFYSKVHERFSPRGFTILAVSVDEHDDAVQRFLTRMPLPFPILRDPTGTVPAKLDVAIETMPTSVLLGPDGRILYMHSGFVSGDELELEARIERAILDAEKAPGDAPKEEPVQQIFREPIHEEPKVEDPPAQSPETPE